MEAPGFQQSQVTARLSDLTALSKGSQLRFSVSSSSARQSPAIIQSPDSPAQSVAGAIMEATNDASVSRHGQNPSTPPILDPIDFDPPARYTSHYYDLKSVPSIVSEYHEPNKLDTTASPRFADADEKQQTITKTTQNLSNVGSITEATHVNPGPSPSLYDAVSPDERPKEASAESCELRASNDVLLDNQNHEYFITQNTPFLDEQVNYPSNIESEGWNGNANRYRDKYLSPKPKSSRSEISYDPASELVHYNNGEPSNLLGLGIFPETWKTSNVPITPRSQVPVNVASPNSSMDTILRKMNASAASRSPFGGRRGFMLAAPDPELAGISRFSAPSHNQEQVLDETPPPKIVYKSSPRPMRSIRKVPGRYRLAPRSREPPLPLAHHIDLNVFVRRRTSSRGIRVCSIRISRTLADATRVSQEQWTFAANLSLDNVSFFHTVRHEYYSVLLGSSAVGRFWRRWCSAKQLSGVIIFPARPRYIANKEDESFTEEQFLYYFRKPAKCTPGCEWIQWAYILASGEFSSQRNGRSFEEQAAEKLSNRSYSRESPRSMSGAGSGMTPTRKGIATTRTTRAFDFMGEAGGDIEFVESWDVQRICLAIVLVILTSLLFFLLWIFCGPKAAAELVQGTSAAASRVGYATLLSLLSLLTGSFGLFVWVWVSWLLM